MASYSKKMEKEKNMKTKKVFLKSKSVREDLNWIIFVEALQNFPRIDLTYQYRLEFKKVS